MAEHKKKKAFKFINLKALALVRPLVSPSLAERGGFEPPVPVFQYVSLANWWFQPLTHLSGLNF